MNILWVCPWMPGPYRPRTVGLLRSLARRGHRIRVVALDVGEPCWNGEPGVEVVSVKNRPNRARLRAATAFACGKSITSQWAAEPAWRDAVQRAAAEPGWDLIHAEHVRSWPALEGLNSLPLVWDAVDAVSVLYRRLANQASNPFAKAWRLREADAIERLERQLLGRASASVCTTDDEASLLRALRPDSRPVVVPNGVDFATHSDETGDDHHRTGPVVVCSGKWRHVPNRLAMETVLESIWPRVRVAIPDAQLWIVGADPPRAWAAKHGAGGIRVLPNVPEMTAVLRRADVSLCAVQYAAGIQNKILEALAAGIPVVSTAEAARPIPGAVACGAVRPAETFEGLADETIRLLRHPEEARSRGDAGRRWASENCRWDMSAMLLEKVWDEVSC